MKSAHQGMQSRPDPPPALNRLTLLISSAVLEERFWKSVRVLKILDLVGLFNSTMLNAMLVRKFGWGSHKPEMLWHFLPVALYLTAGLVQLAVLLLLPELHQHNRFAINLTNRLVKAVTVTWAAVNMSQTDVMNQFTGTLNSVPHAAGGEHSATTYMKILRTVASLPLLWVSHAVNFMLPFWLLLPLQLCTLLAVSRVVPSIVCVLLEQPTHILQPASVIAAHVHGVARTIIAVAVPMPSQLPWETDAPVAGSPVSRTKDLLVLVAITFTLILMVIPCVVAYHVERTWKLDFLETQRLLSERSGAVLEAAPHQTPRRVSLLWATFDIIWMSLLVCETIVQTAPAVRCEK